MNKLPVCFPKGKHTISLNGGVNLITESFDRASCRYEALLLCGWKKERINWVKEVEE